MSAVFYRWGAGRDESRVTFDGTHISVFDLKREIILNNRMGNGKDFDLAVYDNITGDELKDDNHQIPRATSVVARRLPASGKGRGTAQNYIVGTAAGDSLTGDHRIEAHARDAMKDKLARGARGAAGTYASMTRRFDGKEEKKPGPSVPITTGDADEDARIQAMLQQNAETWDAMQDEMTAQPRFNVGQNRRPPGRPGAGAGGPGGGGPKFDFSMPPDRDPPPGYICYRCGQKGHWIQNCPSNEDPEAADRKRFVRVTGIPRSFLQTVETPTTGEGSSAGAMLTADGGFVRAVADERAWAKQAAARPRALLGPGQDVRDAALGADQRALACPLCRRLIWDAVRVPCCATAYCDECVTEHLVGKGWECPACESKIESVDKLVPDDELRAQVAAFVDEMKGKGAAGEEGKEVEEGEKVEQPLINGKDKPGPNSGPLPDMPSLQAYRQALLDTLRNPLVPPALKDQLRVHIDMTNANIQMQLMAAQGFLPGMPGMPGMAGLNGMGGMNGMNGMNNMGGMNGAQGGGAGGQGVGPGHMGALGGPGGQFQQQGQHPQPGFGPQPGFQPGFAPGRGGFGFNRGFARGMPRGRGGFARGGGAAGAPGMRKRPAEDEGGGGGYDKVQRVM